MLTFWFLLQESATRRVIVHHHQCDEEAGEVPAASSLISSSLTGIPSFSFLPSLSSLPGLVLTLPALHSQQSLPTVIRTQDVGVVDCCPPQQPADPFTRTWNPVLGCQSRYEW